MVETLKAHDFLRFRFLFFTGHPLYKKCCVVVGQKVVVEVLLHKISRDKVLERNEGIVLFIKYYHPGDLTKGRKDLHNVKIRILLSRCFLTYMY